MAQLSKVKPVKITWSLHPQEFAQLSAAELAELTKAAGFDTCTVLIGKGKHAEITNIYPALPDYVNALSKAGIETTTAEIELGLEQLVGEPDFLKLLQACGIEEFSIASLVKKGYFVRSRLTKARGNLEKLQPLLEDHNLKLILPVTGGSLLPSPSAAFHLVRGLMPNRIGVQCDPGGAMFEGFEAWDYTVAILMDYLACITVRDNVLLRHPGADDANNKGWARRWATVQEGMTDWQEIARQLRNIEFVGRIELRPMVSLSVEEIKSELDFLKSAFG